MRTFNYKKLKNEKWDSEIISYIAKIYQELDKDDINTKMNIGYLPSEINLYNDMTVKQILDYHESFYDKKCSKNSYRLYF